MIAAIEQWNQTKVEDNRQTSGFHFSATAQSSLCTLVKIPLSQGFPPAAHICTHTQIQSVSGGMASANSGQQAKTKDSLLREHRSGRREA